jgi:hypothetical protein
MPDDPVDQTEVDSVFTERQAQEKKKRKPQTS